MFSQWTNTSVNCMFKINCQRTIYIPKILQITNTVSNLNFKLLLQLVKTTEMDWSVIKL